MKGNEGSSTPLSFHEQLQSPLIHRSQKFFFVVVMNKTKPTIFLDFEKRRRILTSPNR